MHLLLRQLLRIYTESAVSSVIDHHKDKAVYSLFEREGVNKLTLLLPHL